MAKAAKLTSDRVRKVLGDLARAAGSQQAAAVRLGVSATHFSDVVRGRQRPGPKILAALGLSRREDVYEQAVKR